VGITQRRGDAENNGEKLSDNLKPLCVPAPLRGQSGGRSRYVSAATMLLLAWFAYFVVFGLMRDY
jgi:hypothetical protein